MTHLFTCTHQLIINRMRATIEILKKVPEFAKEKGISEIEILEARLAPDMLPFRRQVDLISDNAKGFCARLNEIENPNMADDEETSAELILRLEKTINFLVANPIKNTERAEALNIQLPSLKGKALSGENYVTEWLIPNFHFHATMAYAILRHLGMPLGKSDFINGLTTHELNS